MSVPIGDVLVPPPPTFTATDEHFLTAFFALQLTGFISLALIVFTVFASSDVAKRNICWVNFMCAWLFSAVSYSLLVGQSIDWVPPHGLCMTQAVLVYTLPSLSACATLSLMIHVLISINAILATSHAPRTAPEWVIPVLATFPLASLGMAALPLYYGLREPHLVVRRDANLYCGIDNGIPGRVSAIVVAIIMLFCLCIEVTIVTKLVRNWENLRKRRRNRPLISLSIRILVFALLGVLAIGLALVFVFVKYHGPVINIILATLPVFAAIIFGSQQDIIDVWRALLHGRRPVKAEYSTGTSGLSQIPSHTHSRSQSHPYHDEREYQSHHVEMDDARSDIGMKHVRFPQEGQAPPSAVSYFDFPYPHPYSARAKEAQDDDSERGMAV
ncbi:hypothetical protein CYLTODRAFT_491641 [Cylindrobasidium torrendii FP15055 ss-10]|uniref:G-protein coupled receptors family 1 profile domain-containing protein n=1 Tax=Cylindrobasidium torrendii FP15055 ss-10 TaxID=1314674 RepID=A0A0D7B7U2_9AGAR|nr:hypothetical protein CYLTODRAFT_491641 [Cylindrobasidium torrendii FP15055 ss-10]